MSALPSLLRSRGRNNSLHDINRAADRIELLEGLLAEALAFVDTTGGQVFALKFGVDEQAHLQALTQISDDSIRLSAKLADALQIAARPGDGEELATKSGSGMNPKTRGAHP